MEQRLTTQNKVDGIEQDKTNQNEIEEHGITYNRIKRNRTNTTTSSNIEHNRTTLYNIKQNSK